jgi:hypothetical protein
MASLDASDRMPSGGAILPAGLKGLELLRDVHWLRADNVAFPIETVVGGS